MTLEPICNYCCISKKEFQQSNYYWNIGIDWEKFWRRGFSTILDLVDNGFLIAALKKDGFLRFLTKTFFIIKSIASNTVMLDDGSSANLEPEVSSGIFTILVYSTYQTAIKQYQ